MLGWHRGTGEFAPSRGAGGCAGRWIVTVVQGGPGFLFRNY